MPAPSAPVAATSLVPALSRIWNSRLWRCARAETHARAVPREAASFAERHRTPGPCSYGPALARWSAHGRVCRFSFSFVPAAGAWAALRKNQFPRRRRVGGATSGRATRAGGEHSAAAKPRRRRLSQNGAAAAGPAARRRWSRLARLRGIMDGVPRGCPLRLQRGSLEMNAEAALLEPCRKVAPGDAHEHAPHPAS